jgi:hypothetical protein
VLSSTRAAHCGPNQTASAATLLAEIERVAKKLRGAG